MQLPAFAVTEYAALVGRLGAAGYRFSPIVPGQAGAERCVYLRHDIDFVPSACLEMAGVEAAAGCVATYYLLVSGEYNLCSARNRQVVAELVALGHEVGLHYDLGLYPTDPAAAARELDREADALSQLTGRPVRTISMHNPHAGGSDMFRQSEKYRHPHDPRWQDDLMYVSDSCRGWRDENLLRCFGGDPPRRLMLLTHPELWLDGTVVDRRPYFETVLKPRAVVEIEQFMDAAVWPVWCNHAGARAHDARTAAERGPV